MVVGWWLDVVGVVNSVVVTLFVLMNLGYLLKITCFAVDCDVLWALFGQYC